MQNLELMVKRKEEGRDLSRLVNHFVFTGSPGTGKTSVTRLIGRTLFSLGILATKELVETSATDLIGWYVWHTRKSLKEKMKAGRGGILFIDEAYYLGEGSYWKESLGKLLNMLTLPEYMDGKTIVVLAGYKEQMHEMLENNPRNEIKIYKVHSFWWFWFKILCWCDRK